MATQLNIPIDQDIESHKYKRDMGLAQRIAKKLGIGGNLKGRIRIS